MIKKIVKKLLGLNFFLPVIKGNRFIFIYHDVSNIGSPTYSKHYSTTPDCFKRQLTFFKKHFELVSLEKIVAPDLQKNKNYAAIVFDDGFKTIKTECVTILKSFDIPFAIFVNKAAILQNRLWLSDLELGNSNLKQITQSEFVNNKNDDLIESLKKSPSFNNNIAKYMNACSSDNYSVYLDESEIKELHAQGVIIGSHTVNHPVLANCDEAVQQLEIEENKRYLDHLLGQNTQHFAFPFGKREHFSKKTIELLKNAGHTFFYSSNPTSFKKNNISEGLIPRIGLLNDDESQIMFYINRQFLKTINL